MFKFYCSFLLMFTCLPTMASDESYNQIGCEVYDMQKQLIRRFPGAICAFMEDGSFLAAQKENLVLYDHLRNQVWSKKIYPHHQINLSLDKKFYLVIGSERIRLKEEIVRSDVLYVMNKAGEILKTFKLYENRKQFLDQNWKSAELRKFKMVWDIPLYQEVAWEVTHANSFKEIPPNKISRKFSEFAEGNYIVNDVSLMITFVLNHDLTKILWQKPLVPGEWIMLHDVQVLPESEDLLFFDNGSPQRPTSRLVRYNLADDRIVWQFPEKFSSTFYSKKMGGVQILENKNFLFSDLTNQPKAVEITPEGKIVWSMDHDLKAYFQQVNRLDLSQFLKKNRGI